MANASGHMLVTDRTEPDLLLSRRIPVANGKIDGIFK